MNKLLILFLFLITAFSVFSNEIISTKKFIRNETRTYHGKTYQILLEGISDTEVVHQISYDKSMIKKVIYTSNEWGFRDTKIKYPKLAPQKHWILAGDSNIYGEWCTDVETIDSNLSKLIDNYQFYNWGKRGGGPHNTLFYMQTIDFSKQIKQPDGIFTYTFFPYYMYSRIIGSKNYLAWDKGESPYYVIDNDKLKNAGTFNDRFFFTSFYKYLASNSVLNKLIIDLPPITRNDIELVAAIFNEMKVKYKQLFPKGKFIVLINDSQSKSIAWQTDLLIKNLKEKQVYVEKIEFNKTNNGLEFLDGHINGLGQKRQAELYVKILKKYL